MPDYSRYRVSSERIPMLFTPYEQYGCDNKTYRSKPISRAGVIINSVINMPCQSDSNSGEAVSVVGATCGDDGIQCELRGRSMHDMKNSLRP